MDKKVECVSQKKCVDNTQHRYQKNLNDKVLLLMYIPCGLRTGHFRMCMPLPGTMYIMLFIEQMFNERDVPNISTRGG